MNKKEYLLTCLLDDLSDVQKSVSKALKFGLDDKLEGATNLEIIEYDLLDVSVILDMLEEEGVNIDTLPLKEYDELAKDKRQKLSRWMDYSKERGALIE